VRRSAFSLSPCSPYGLTLDQNSGVSAAAVGIHEREQPASCGASLPSFHGARKRRGSLPQLCDEQQALGGLLGA